MYVFIHPCSDSNQRRLSLLFTIMAWMSNDVKPLYVYVITNRCPNPCY